jgi:hypothetical protein
MPLPIPASARKRHEHHQLMLDDHHEQTLFAIIDQIDPANTET